MNPIAKRVVTALSIAALVVVAIVKAPVALITPAVSVLAALAIIEYAQLLARKLRPFSLAYALALLGGSATLVVCLSALALIARVYDSTLMLLYVIAIVKLSDMGGFAFGLSSKRIFGDNHKLCPTISPNKSWEGLLGSVVGSCLISSLLMPMTGFGPVESLTLGVVAALVGTFGDLVESKFKRWVGVKDSSTMKFTNGMGGVLDMLDSLLFAPAVIFVLMKYVFS